MKQYYIHNGTEQLGPLTLGDLKQKSILRDTYVWFEGLEDWNKAGDISELNDLFKETTPPPFKPVNKIPPPFKAKNNTPPPFHKNKTHTPPPLKKENENPALLQENKKKPPGIAKKIEEVTKNDTKTSIESDAFTKKKGSSILKKMLMFSVGAIIYILFFYGHDLFQELKSVNRQSSVENISSNNDENKNHENGEALENQTLQHEEPDPNVQIDETDRVQPTENSLSAWGCSQCGKVIYTDHEPNIQNCPVGYHNDGGSFGTTHNWAYYGKQGNNYYSCKYCGLQVQVEGFPKNNSGYCNYHEEYQGHSSWHSWKE